MGLGTVLLVRHTTGSFAAAGAIAAASGTQALAGSRTSALVDRCGPAAVLRPAAALFALAVTAFTTLACSMAPLWTLLVTALLSGVSLLQLGDLVRAHWADLLGESPAAGKAMAFESVTDVAVFILGPLVVAVLGGGVHPAAPLLAAAVLYAAGGLLVAHRSTTGPSTTLRQPAHRSDSAGRVVGIQVLALGFLGVGTFFGFLQITFSVHAKELGHPGLGGVFYALFTMGILMSALACGRMSPSGALPQRILITHSCSSRPPAPR